MKDTRERAYTERLERKGTWWKRLLDVQRPYRWNLKRLQLGHVLDIGCGIGRNLDNLSRIGIQAVGVDHNIHSVKEARQRGFEALHTEAFANQYGHQQHVFDSLLIAHVIEHMTREAASTLLAAYLDLLKPGGQIVIITPQEAGFASDATHIEFMDPTAVGQILRANGLVPERAYSFPFPRLAGRIFLYNEFVTVGIKPR